MPMIESLIDVEPQFANARDYWLGYGRERRAEDYGPGPAQGWSQGRGPGQPAAPGVGQGITYYRSGIAQAQLNGVLRFGGARLDEAIAQARHQLEGVPWTWWVGPDSAYPGLADSLVARGAATIGTMPVMAVQLDKVKEVQAPPRVTIERISGLGGLQEWVHAYAPSYGVPPDQEDDTVTTEATRPDPEGSLLRFAARLNGEVVGTSALFARHGVAGIYAVATVEKHRGRGIGTLLTATALRAGRERGLRVGTLQASAAGASVYRRMGFETVAGYRLFRMPRF